MSVAPNKPGVKQDARHEGDTTVTVPNLSASVMLIAPLRTRTEDGYDYRVLLLQRNKGSSTFNSAHVFPGGNIDAGDSMKEWDEFYPTNSPLNEAQLKERSIKICALRETFEEAGVLLTECLSVGGGKKKWEGITESERRVWRDKVHSNGSTFIDLFRFLRGADAQSTIRPSLSTLQYRANWITPRNMKRRFDTHFFASILPSSFVLDAETTTTSAVMTQTIGSSDGKETVSADWITPSEAIKLTLAPYQKSKSPTHSDDASTSDKSMILFPPQFYLLAELIEIKNWRDLVDRADHDIEGSPKVKSRLIIPFEPEMRAVHTANSTTPTPATVLPGDPAHSLTSTLFPTASPHARHRTYVILPPKVGVVSEKGEGWKSKAPLGLTVMGLHREGMGSLMGGEGEGWGDLKRGEIGENGSKL